VPFPEHIGRILDAYGVRTDTKSALYDLYISMGDEVLEVFADLADHSPSVDALSPEDTTQIRAAVAARYLTRNHPQWLDGKPTPSLWHPRVAEGRAAGLATPLGPVSAEMTRVVGGDQPLPEGIVILGRNAHFGGRQETISFDVVAADLQDAIALAHAAGQQHTMPGSAGATSGTFDGVNGIALVWEIQPNVYKPAGDRNREIAKIYRRHRNWHLVTLTAALDWLHAQGCAIYILRGEALATVHEVNPEKPVSPTIVDLHNRTVARVIEALGLTLRATNEDDGLLLLNSVVMNHALRQEVLRGGPTELVWRLVQ
jgi:hypothetical protein